MHKFKKGDLVRITGCHYSAEAFGFESVLQKFVGKLCIVAWCDIDSHAIKLSGNDFVWHSNDIQLAFKGGSCV